MATVASGVLRALSICTPAAFLNVSTALAQPLEPRALAADIPAEPLAQALEGFARQTGLQLVYLSGVLRDQRSHAVSAGLGADEALARMLEGTALKFEYLTPRSIRILASVVGPPPEPPTATHAGDELQQVTVTANRREENLQKVPITMQVLSGDTLAKLNATTFDDFVKYLPGVTAHGVGPGQNNIYVRGLATASFPIQGSGYVGSFPNVALYLDEQSAQLPNRNLDLYAADLDRVEILEGPQGTLFGAGAQAGVVRYITNKPKLDVTEAIVNAGGATTAHGAQSGNINATLNIPLIAEHLAARAVVYDEHRGGYIDNIPATFARKPTDLGIYYANYPTGCGPNSTPASSTPCQVPPGSAVINNFNLAANAINPVTYQGIRVETLFQFNEDWNALLAQSYQSIEADGVFAEMAADSLGKPQPDLSVQLFNPSYNKDRFENTALTIDGRIGDLKLVYAGAYLVRNVEQVQDYTNYARGAYADYYQCVNPTSNSNQPNSAAARCFTPSSTWHDIERNTHQTHELRISTPDDWRIRGIGGVFYENYRLEDQTDFFYLTALPYFNPIGPPTGYYTAAGAFVSEPVTSNNPNVRPSGDAFFNDITRGYNQKAAYTSVDFELIPHKLTLTAGTRYSRTETWEVGSTVGGYGCQTIEFPNAPNPCVNEPKDHDFINLNAEHLDRTFSGFKSRANLSWKVAEDALLYYTWSQGFRAGGFNRTADCGCGSPLTAGPYPWEVQATKHGGWNPGLAFAPDTLTNNELGWKTLWLDRRIQWDGTIYQEDWNHAQIPVEAPGIVDLGRVINGGNYRVHGVESSLAARLTSGLSIEAGGAWNHSELVKQASYFWSDGTPIDFSTLETYNNAKVPDLRGVLGTPLAGAPPLKANVRARYEFTFDGYDGFGQIGAEYQSHSLSTTDQLSHDLNGNSTAYQLPAFTTLDGALGLGRHGWIAQIYGENLTDTRAQLFANYSQYYKAITVNRPRTIGLRFSYKFSGW
jgi:iron complex outermembrane recepter protein